MSHTLDDHSPARKVTPYKMRSRQRDLDLLELMFLPRECCSTFSIFAIVYSFCKLFCVCWQSNKECSYLVGSYLKYMRKLFRCFFVPSLPRFFSSKHHPPYPSDCLPARLPRSCP